MWQKSLATSIILVMLALLIWWSQLDTDRAARLLSIEEEHFIDAYMRDIKLTAMNNEGKPGYILNAREFNHYNDSDIAELLEPVLVFIQDGAQWRLSAQRGEINDSHSQIVFYDDVVMQHEPTESSIVPQMRLRTQRLDIDTGAQLASTELPVVIEYRTLTMHSQGMRLNNRSGELELLANVAGVYAAP